jgi:KipI family sensor histidine kinase inhibitor
MRASDTGDAFTLEAMSETSLLLRFGNAIDAELNARVHAAATTLRSAQLRGVVDIVPAYATLMLVYAPAAWSVGDAPAWQAFAQAVRTALATVAPNATRASATVAIPLRYGGKHGADLAMVAAHCGLSENAVIARHSAADYRVAMLGFAPGFAYLLGLDPTLHAPRRADPRTRVPRGSVAIGGAQTGIYPGELPGGWQLIGRTPLVLFDALREPPCLLAAGDRVRFRAIGDDEFAELEREQSR